MIAFNVKRFVLCWGGLVFVLNKLCEISLASALICPVGVALFVSLSKRQRLEFSKNLR